MAASHFDLSCKTVITSQKRLMDQFANVIYQALFAGDTKKNQIDPDRVEIRMKYAYELAQKHRDYRFSNNANLIIDIYTFCCGKPWDLLGKFTKARNWWQQFIGELIPYVTSKLQEETHYTTQRKITVNRFNNLVNFNATTLTISQALSSLRQFLPDNTDNWNVKIWSTAATVLATIPRKNRSHEGFSALSTQLETFAQTAHPEEKWQLCQSLPDTQFVDTLIWNDPNLALKLYSAYFRSLEEAISAACPFLPPALASLTAGFFRNPQHEAALHFSKLHEEFREIFSGHPRTPDFYFLKPVDACFDVIRLTHHINPRRDLCLLLCLINNRMVDVPAYNKYSPISESLLTRCTNMLKLVPREFLQEAETMNQAEYARSWAQDAETTIPEGGVYTHIGLGVVRKTI